MQLFYVCNNSSFIGARTPHGNVYLPDYRFAFWQHIFINKSFCPAPDEILSDLFKVSFLFRSISHVGSIPSRLCTCANRNARRRIASNHLTVGSREKTDADACCNPRNAHLPYGRRPNVCLPSSQARGIYFWILSHDAFHFFPVLPNRREACCGLCSDGGVGLIVEAYVVRTTGRCTRIFRAACSYASDGCKF